MRSHIGVWVIGCSFALGTAAGCGDDERPAGSAGRGGHAGDSGSDASANGGTAGLPVGDAGGDESDGALKDVALEADSAAAVASCRATANGGACSECACDHCIVHISACNKVPKCRAILDCVARTGCPSTTACWEVCGDIILDAETEVVEAARAGDCRTERCASECAPPDASPDTGADAADSGTQEGGRPDGGDAIDKDAASHDASGRDAQSEADE
ncbi:MAG TPA: hypothetical protein VK524_00940 [Polyangiaceae bacterium]|nr:hypothetical protein [Polyangiaceae bacterium]